MSAPHSLQGSPPAPDPSAAPGSVPGQELLQELRALEEDVRIRDDLNRQIIASSSDCTKVLDLQGRLLQMTAQGCRLMELDDFEQVRQSDWTAWWPSAGAALARAAIADAGRGEGVRFTAFGHTFKGTPRWWDNMVSPICDTQGQPMMLLVVSRDITLLHRQQEEIRQLNLGLETRVQQRTEELEAANQRIRQTLSEARALYNLAPCGYHSVNASGTLVQINQTELDWLGYERAEMLGRMSMRDITLPAYQAGLDDKLRRLMQEGKLEATEIGLRRRDGSGFLVLISSTAVYDEQGRFVHSNSTLVDITERKAAENALSAQRNFLQTITDHVPAQLAFYDSALICRFANVSYARMFGVSQPADLQGLHLSQIARPQDYANAQVRLATALTGEVQRFEGRRVLPDGTSFYASIEYTPYWQNGQVQGIFVQVIDISERKRAEERVRQLNDDLEQRVRERSAELLESEQRFRLLVDNLRDCCIFFLDAEGCISDWTDSAQRLQGHTPTAMLGRPYALLFEGSDPQSANAPQSLRRAAAHGQHETSHWSIRKDGSRYWSHSLLIALRDDAGKLYGFAQISRDTTEAKRLDDLLRNVNDELEQRVAERTEQLLSTNKDLESFSYSVSHDLRAPLRHISSFVSLLEEHLGERCDEVSARYLNTLSDSARHMNQLIDGLLAFSRLGRSALTRVPVDLAALVDAVVSQLDHDTGGRVVDWVVADDLPLVQGDALLLREVWANLLDNAFKYTRPRERARIEVGWSVDPVVGYTFFVRDNGVGFDTQYASKLFGVFQRLHRASEFEGTGIGLALTRRIVERHGGGIWAESQPGTGSVFYFSLPFAAVPRTDVTENPSYTEL